MLLIGQRDGQGEGFPWTHRQISKESLPVHETFHAAPCPWNGPTLYVTEHCPGKRRKERIELGIGDSKVRSEPHQGGVVF